MNPLALIGPSADSVPAAPSLLHFLLAGVAGFVVLVVTLSLGRGVESPGRRFALLLVCLVLATATALLVLMLLGADGSFLLPRGG